MTLRKSDTALMFSPSDVSPSPNYKSNVVDVFTDCIENVASFWQRQFYKKIKATKSSE